MGGKRRKIGELGKVDWGTAFDSPEFGGSGRSMRRRSSGGEPPRSRSERPSRPPCDDCNGSGSCSHCRGGFYPRQNGSNAPCGKCRGDLKCHACRGRGFGGKKCQALTYEQSVEKQKAQLQKQAGRVAQGVITAALGAIGAANPGLAVGALPGQEETAAGAGRQWRQSSQQERRDDQTRTLRRGTRDKSVRDRGSGQQ